MAVASKGTKRGKCGRTTRSICDPRDDGIAKETPMGLGSDGCASVGSSPTALGAFTEAESSTTLKGTNAPTEGTMVGGTTEDAGDDC